ncbi:MAG TPA: FAD:protein FMN transferase [Actinotalea sp.]|nr:FAD:protein FMN transferase [Actinotalea sp.]
MSTRALPSGVVGPDHRAWVEHTMGMPISLHVRGPGARSADVAAAVDRVLADLRAADAMFSPWKDDSQVTRLQRGELALRDADPLVREVHGLCEVARERTDGWFDAWSSVPGRPGLFDPTGLVKTWAVARAGRHLRELALRTGLGYAVGAGGDVLTRPAADGAPWLVGIEDPLDRSRVLATLPAGDGGVATSGTAARGTHITDPRTGRGAEGVLSVTVAGPSLMWADVFATAAVAMGPVAVEWVRRLHGTSGLIVLADGSVHRWATPV